MPFAALPPLSSPPPGWAGIWYRLREWIYRHPIVCLFLLGVLSNAAGSAFNITYNKFLIAEHYLATSEQKAAWPRLVLAYNLVVYPLGVAVMLYLIGPLAFVLRALRDGEYVPPESLDRSRRLLINLPFLQVCINCFGWLPAGVFFPLGIGLLGGWDNAGQIWGHFLVSHLVSALLTTVQTLFLIEAFLIEFVYPYAFADARPAAVPGTFKVPLAPRLLLLWMAATLVPMAALLVVALNMNRGDFQTMRYLAGGVAVAGLFSSGLVSWMVASAIIDWVRAHARATEQIRAGNYKYHIPAKRPDEWGELTDRFNDMAAELAHAQFVRQTFGQFVRSDVLDEILANLPGLGGSVEELTVMFLDIRGFTRRSAGEPPERVVELLNRFLSLAVTAVEDNGGLVNKFLGDGLMALFNVPHRSADHADQAVRAGLTLLWRLTQLNGELAAQGQPPLRVGIGIHTGPALVGCVGAAWEDARGRTRIQREFTAIGETVNLAQRIEQLTKSAGGPILLTAATADLLRAAPPLEPCGRHQLPGFEEPVVVFRVLANGPGPAGGDGPPPGDAA